MKFADGCWLTQKDYEVHNMSGAYEVLSPVIFSLLNNNLCRSFPVSGGVTSDRFPWCDYIIYYPEKKLNIQ